MTYLMNKTRTETLCPNESCLRFKSCSFLGSASVLGTLSSLGYCYIYSSVSLTITPTVNMSHKSQSISLENC